MSIETIGWAKRQTCGCPFAKAVLGELANWSRADGICEFRKVSDIAQVIEVSERTVQRALKRLEDRREDGGLGLIRRVTRVRKDGGQSANCFQLVGYIYPGDCPSPPGCPVDGGGGDYPVTPYMDLESNLIKTPHSPPSRRKARAAIPPDWQAPALAELPATAQTLASQWPQGAYAAEAEAFHQHWLGTGQRGADWSALWAARVQERHAAVMRAVQAGVRFPMSAGAASVRVKAPAAPNPPPPPVAAQAREDDRSARLRTMLREKVAESIWDRYLAPAALLFDAPGLKVYVPTAAGRDWLETNFTDKLLATAKAIEPGLQWVWFETETRRPERVGAARPDINHGAPLPSIVEPPAGPLAHLTAGILSKAMSAVREVGE